MLLVQKNYKNITGTKWNQKYQSSIIGTNTLRNCQLKVYLHKLNANVFITEQ